MVFEYKYLEKNQLSFVWDRGILRIKPNKKEFNFGTLKSYDGI